jgi:arginine utilization protein RocB
LKEESVVTKESIYDLLLQLAKIPSVSPSREERRIAQAIYDRLADTPYFSSNKGSLQLLPIEGDTLGRQSVCAIVRAKPPTPKTVVMIGHMDVVETSESRELKELAFDPEEYTRQLFRLTLPEDARLDLDSGDYLFGRGVFDMKCGVAVEVEFLRECAEHPENLDANVMLLIVGDEENRSAGMTSAINHLAHLQEEGLDYVACVNAEGASQRSHGDKKRYVSLGTIGKMMPVFYCVGRESHVGSYYEGLNANLLASAVNMVLEGSPEWIDSAGSEVYPPPTALKHRDLRDIYSVTLPAKAVTYFNYLYANKTPADALEMMKSVASSAFQLALDRLKHSAEVYSSRQSGEKTHIPWQPRVLTDKELLESVESHKRGSLKEHLDSFVDGLPDTMDDRDKSIEVIGEVLRFYADKDPAIIVGFLPPFYPHLGNRRASKRELDLLDAVEALIEEARDEYGEVLVTEENFAAISDLSYMGFQGTREDLMPLAENTPGWGKVYNLPLEVLLKLDVPVVNLGPSGRDAHKYTERLDLRYYLGPYPILFRSLIRRLSKLE